MSRSEHVGTDEDVPTERSPERSSVARFSLGAEAVALADLFECDPAASVELVPAVAAPDDLAILIVRTDDLDREAVDDLLRADPAVDRVDRVGGCADGWEYGVRWSDPVHRLVGRIVAEGAVVASATARNGRWYLRVTSHDRGTLLTVHEFLGEFDSSAECLSISTLDGEESARCVLTEKQRRTVMAAFEAGYYHVPRKATTEDVADVLDISHQAVSERFRRAHAELVRAHLPVREATP